MRPQLTPSLEREALANLTLLRMEELEPARRVSHSRCCARGCVPWA